ncbi:SHOCT domain-containing protein [Kitasatospora terrestris]|uniref:SHOCT domain-containing protein n=1 Tax=Kitasatospora terrestris TaxID=258051 RepID=A0ABP9EAW1_9ACTN
MGLLRGVARTAVVAGTATAVSNRVSRRQAGRWADQEAAQQQQYAQQQQQYAPPPPPPPAAPPTQAATMDQKLDQLKDLAALRDQGVLTEQEFEAQKSRILGG